LAGRIPAPLAAERDFLAAEAWRAMGYFAKAEALYRRVLSRADAGRDLRADSAMALAAICRSLGRVNPARTFLRRARDFFGKNRARANRRRLELEGALIDRARGLYPQSLRRLQALLSAFSAEKDFASAAFALWAMGGARRFSGDLRGALADFKASLVFARRAADKTAEAYAFLGMGGAARVAGRPADSELYYARAARLLSGTEDVFGQAYAECGLANALRQKGDYARAGRRYKRAHRLYASIGDAVDLAYVDWGLGQVAFHLGNPEGARRRFEAALAAFEKAGEARGAVISLTALAAVLHSSGRTHAAEALFRRALRESCRAKIHAHLEALT
ncbi:MAG: tetratricopeptide repeat protein, partial [Elusimicrobia bacterium]|nr:tetratricopeptide repeat protein [Elusimicrobiota bacterium]